MSKEKVERALKLLLRLDESAFKFILHMSNFKEEVTVENLTAWLNKVAEEDDGYDLNILIEDIESNLSEHTTPQQYFVEKGIVVTKPILISTDLPYTKVGYLYPRKMTSKIITTSMITNILLLSIGANGMDRTLALLEDKQAFIEIMRRTYWATTFQHQSEIIDQLFDDTETPEGVVQMSVCKNSIASLSGHVVHAVLPIFEANGDLSFQFHLSINSKIN